MTVTRRRISSVVLGCALLVLMLFIVSLSNLVQPRERPPMTVREVELYTPPPPPPPQASQSQKSSQSRPNVIKASIKPPLELEQMDLDVQIESGGYKGTGLGGVGDLDGPGYGNLDVSNLDRIPEVLNSPVYLVPQDIVEHNIKSVSVQLHIVIDETGRAYLVEVLESSYPPYNKYLADYVSKVRFTPPTLMGVRVRAEYNWPVRFRMQ